MIVVVGYIKVQHLYRFFSPLAHVLLSFCVEYALLTFSTVFMLVQVVRCSMHIFIAVWFPKDNCRSSQSILGIVGRPRAVMK